MSMDKLILRSKEVGGRGLLVVRWKTDIFKLVKFLKYMYLSISLNRKTLTK